MSYKGKYRVKNLNKYKGDATKIVYRSLWERNTFRWCDDNPKVVAWSSEELVIGYRCPTDNKIHRYFTDLFIEFDSGAKYVIEIKPKAQTKPPRARNRKKLLQESFTYAKNMAKWNAATAYCQARGYEFEVWTEDTLRSLGITIL